MRYTDLLQYKDTDLRDYQQQHKEEVYEAWDAGHRSVMLQMPTGTGKTRVFVSIIKDLQKHFDGNYRVLVLAHREEILSQISYTLFSEYQVSCGKIDSKNHPQHNKVFVASVQTMKNRLAQYKDGFDLIVVDEAHHTPADSYKMIINAFPTAKILGVTATPYRLIGKGFEEEYDKLILSSTIEAYINRGVLSEIEYLPTDIIIKNCDSIRIGADGDYMKEVLFTHMDNPMIYSAITDAYKKFANNKKGIVYTINQGHNTKLKKWFEDIGVPTEAIDSETPANKRKDIIGSFKRGEIKVLCNVDIFGEGFDCPDVDFILLARPTKSLSLYLQQVGRGLRKADNKERVQIIDCVGSYTRFGLPTKERDWQKHFEGKGKEIDYTPNSTEKERVRRIREDYGLSVEIREIEIEEDLSQLKDLFTLPNTEHSYEDEFHHYIKSVFGFEDSWVRRHIQGIKLVDEFIKTKINKEFTSIFYTIDRHLITEWTSKLNRASSFKEYIYGREKRDNIITLALVRYDDFVWSREQKLEKDAIQAKQEVVKKENQDIIDNILANRGEDITKEDIEVTLATMHKLKLSTFFDQKFIESMKAILLSRYKKM